MIKRLIYAMFSVCLIFAVTGCGGATGSDAPEGTTITFTPTSTSVSDATGVNRWDRDSFKIIVKNSNGIPLSNVKLNISFPFAKGASMIQLFTALPSKRTVQEPQLPELQDTFTPV